MMGPPSRPFGKSWVLLVAWPFWAGVALPQEPAPEADARQEPSETDEATIAKLLAAHNSERAKAKKKPLTLNLQLTAAARAQAADMVKQQKMTHDGSDGSKPSDRVTRAGYHYEQLGENVARAPTVEKVMQIWMNSPPHKANILGAFQEMGAAFATDQDGTTYWCVDFGLPVPQLDPEKAAVDVVAALNRERAKAKRAPLAVNEALMAVARDQARALATRGKLDANGRGIPSVLPRLEAAGYHPGRIAEEFAARAGTPEKAVEIWIKPKAHRKHLLGNYQEVGAGYATAADGTPFWSLILASPAEE
jgi:uncharacterized protein YkwD